MSPWDALLHLLNFVAPAIGLGLIASLLAKGLWRKEFRGVPLRRLATWTAASGVAVLVCGLVVFGHDGRMASYGLLVLSTAAVLWWQGFRPWR
jgi:hypothetical protein